MYIPKQYKGHNLEEALSFMERFSFATLVSNGDGLPEVTHLPFVTRRDGEKIVLISHLARANAHAALLATGKHKVIFQEPHAYISPALYERKPSVPTWDYVAVHATGKVRVLDDVREVMQLITGTIAHFDKAYLPEMDRLPADYLNPLLRELLAFEIEVEELEFKQKISQDRSNSEREKIMAHLAKGADGSARNLAEEMKKEKGN